MACESASLSDISIPIGLLDDVSSATSTDQLLNAFTVWANRMLRADKAGIAFVVSPTRMALTAMDGNKTWQNGREFDMAGTSMGRCYETGQVALYRDVARQPYADLKLIADFGVTTVINAPLLAHGRVFGVMGIGLIRNDGDFTYETAVSGAIGRCIGTQLLVVDQIRTLSRQSLTDPMTGAFNRRFLTDELAAAWARWRSDRRTFAIISVDLDHFKQINDRYGHDAGDVVLIEVARRIMGQIAASDHLVRMGGEEFAVLIRDTSLDQAALLCSTLHEAIRDRPVMFDDTAIPVTASFGVVRVSDRDGHASDVTRRADIAVYRSKADGRDRITIG